MTFSSGGFGTPAHVVGELFKLETGTRATHVPYPQFPQAIADLLNGTNQFMFITTLPVVDLIATGKLRALAVTAPKRIAVFKEVSSIVEQGFPRLVVEGHAVAEFAEHLRLGPETRMIRGGSLTLRGGCANEPRPGFG